MKKFGKVLFAGAIALGGLTAGSLVDIGDSNQAFAAEADYSGYFKPSGGVYGEFSKLTWNEGASQAFDGVVTKNQTIGAMVKIVKENNGEAISGVNVKLQVYDYLNNRVVAEGAVYKTTSGGYSYPSLQTNSSLTPDGLYEVRVLVDNNSSGPGKYAIAYSSGNGFASEYLTIR